MAASGQGLGLGHRIAYAKVGFIDAVDIFKLTSHLINHE
jgi:hypothetical protein